MIKLHEELFVLTDGVPADGDLFTYIAKGGLRQIAIFDYHDMHDSENFATFRKITHSTKPLESVSSEGDEMGAEFVFDKVKEVSLIAVEQAVYGYNVEEIAEEEGMVSNIEKWSFADGFRTYRKIAEMTLFNLGDIQKAITFGAEKLADCSEEETFEFIRSLLPKEEWNVVLDGETIKIVE